jgi:CRP-like cAMP-binding protein
MSVQIARTNLLLDVLSDADVATLLAEFRCVELSAGQDLYAPDVEISRVYFPLSGLSSLMAKSRAGAVDVGPIGLDGMIGLPIYLDAPTGPLSATVHVTGDALEMTAQAFRSCLRNMPELDRILRRYVQWTYAGMGVWVACARLHEVQQRCARWLLMAHDRVRLDRFPLTHDYLAAMLGVRRPTVSAAAMILQEAGLIRYLRGVITIRDRTGLERAACDCYATVTDDYEALFSRRLRPMASPLHSVR